MAPGGGARPSWPPWIRALLFGGAIFCGEGGGQDPLGPPWIRAWIDMSQPDAELPGGGPLCLLCDKSGGKTLRKAATFGLDAKVRRCAAITGDKALIRKLSCGDMIAIDAVSKLSVNSCSA